MSENQDTHEVSRTAETREVLAERLREMAREKKAPLREMKISARWNYIHFENKKRKFVCDRCGKEYMVPDLGSRKQEINIVRQMQELGYDAKLQYVCNGCLGKPTTTRAFKSKKDGHIDDDWRKMVLLDMEDIGSYMNDWEIIDIPYTAENEVFMFRLNQDVPYIESEKELWSIRVLYILLDLPCTFSTKGYLSNQKSAIIS